MLANAAPVAVMGGTAAPVSDAGTFSAVVRCRDSNGEVPHGDGRPEGASNSAGAVLITVETWVDAVPAVG